MRRTKSVEPATPMAPQRRKSAKQKRALVLYYLCVGDGWVNKSVVGLRGWTDGGRWIKA